VPKATIVAISRGFRPSAEYARKRIAPPDSVFMPTLWPMP